MANSTILQLPVAIALTGDEWMEIVQLTGSNPPTYISKRITLLQLAQYVEAMTVPAPNVVTGQQAVAASAIALPSSTLRNGVWLKAAQTNTAAVFAGNSNVNTNTDGTGTGYRLDQGDKLFFAVNNLDIIYVIGTAADVVFWEGS